MKVTTNLITANCHNCNDTGVKEDKELMYFMTANPELITVPCKECKIWESKTSEEKRELGKAHNIYKFDTYFEN